MISNKNIEMSIIEFNERLVENGEEINIITYIKKVNEEFFNIDIDFIDDFIELVNKDECCIPHEMLYKYGVIKTSNSNDILTLLKQNEFLEESDYVALRNVPQCSSSLSRKTEYLLKPDTFKFCLIRAKNTKVYAQYYLLLEKCIKHYNDYQILQLKQKLMNICHNRVLELEDDDKKECFVLLKNNEFKEHPYSVIRGQIKNLQKTLTKIKRTEADIILNIPCCYANNLYNKIKEELRGKINFQKKYLYIDDDGKVIEQSYYPDMMENDYNQVTITRNIGLTGVSLNTFIKTVMLIDEERYDI